MRTMAIYRSLLVAIISLISKLHSSSGYSLKGKRAIVTGSSGGIGKGIALALAEQGVHVVVHYHTREKGAEQTAAEITLRSNTGTTPGKVAGVFQCDFRDPQAIRDWFSHDIDVLWPDGFDILVNNAGIVTKLALEDDDNDLSAWYETMQVNLHAPRLLSHLSVPRMRNDFFSSNATTTTTTAAEARSAPSGGVILNVSSIHGEKSNEYVGPYAVSKSALDALTRAMALEYASYNIRVNAIAPGVVPVERTAAAFAQATVADPWLSRIPLNRLGTVEQVAAACLPLLTNDWLTGAVWQIDGGMMARSNMPDRPRPINGN